MKIKTTNNRGYAQKSIITIIIVVVSIGAVLLVKTIFFQDDGRQNDEPKVEMKMTETEKQAINEAKKHPEKKLEHKQQDAPVTPLPSETSGVKATAHLLLTNTEVVGEEIRASGFATNIVEEGGQCTFYFRQGDKTVKKPATTLTNPTSTTCATVKFPRSELGGGTWQVWLEYNSSRYSGASDKGELLV